LIRDGADEQRHVDYIHSNPVKHGLADAAFGAALLDQCAAGLYRKTQIGMFNIN